MNRWKDTNTNEQCTAIFSDFDAQLDLTAVLVAYPCEEGVCEYEWFPVEEFFVGFEPERMHS